MSANQYEAIRQWGIYSGSFPYYWKAQQEQAATDGAPLDAIYREDNGKWVTVRDLAPGHRFHKIMESV